MFDGDSTRVWIGLSDIHAENSFTWSDGSKFFSSEGNWYYGEPNNNGNNEDCVERLSDGRWNDLPCTGYPRKVLCERPVNALCQNL